MPLPLDGPRRPPAAGGKPTALVVLLHGYGADGNDLISLADPLGAAVPHAAFASPHAIAPCEMGGPGFQWFGLQGPDGSMAVRLEGADAASGPLAAYLEAELARYGLGTADLALIGFSQGTMMALHVGLQLTPPPAAIIGFSGLLAAPDRPAASRDGRPPVLLIHGTADPVVPFGRMAAAEAALRQIGLAPEILARPGLGHGIDELGLHAAADFLKRHLGAGASKP